MMLMRPLPWLAFIGSSPCRRPPGTLVESTDDQTPDRPADERRPIIVHTAAALRPALEKVAPEFERDTGIRIELRFNASEWLLQNLKLTKQGDLFLPADDSYIDEARKFDLVEQDYPLATLTAVAVFRADFPQDAREIACYDVFRSGFRLAQPNPDAPAIGRATRAALTPPGLWARIEGPKPATVGTVPSAAIAFKLGRADGAIIWDAVAAGFPTSRSPACRSSTRDRERFGGGLQCLVAGRGPVVCPIPRRRARPKALPGASVCHHGRRRNRRPVRSPEEDAEILLYAGAMLRPAVEDTIKDFGGPRARP